MYTNDNKMPEQEDIGIMINGDDDDDSMLSQKQTPTNG